MGRFKLSFKKKSKGEKPKREAEIAPADIYEPRYQIEHPKNPMFNTAFPALEIALSSKPIVFIFGPGKRFAMYGVPKDQHYFVHPKFGLFELDQNYAYLYNKSPCYFFHYKNPKPISIPLMETLFEWLRSNKLRKVRRKDVRHANRLRELINLGEGKDKLYDEIKSKHDSIEEVITKEKENIENELKERQKQAEDNKEPIPQLDEIRTGYYLTEYLVSEKLLTESEKDIFNEKLRAKKLRFNDIIQTLKDNELIAIKKPIPIEVDQFLEDYHAYDPKALTVFVESMRQNDKGLKTMTIQKLKEWIPASIIMALLVGGSVAALILIQNMDRFAGADIGKLLGFG